MQQKVIKYWQFAGFGDVWQALWHEMKHGVGHICGMPRLGLGACRSANYASLNSWAEDATQHNTTHTDAHPWHWAQIKITPAGQKGQSNWHRVKNMDWVFSSKMINTAMPDIWTVSDCELESKRDPWELH